MSKKLSGAKQLAEQTSFQHLRLKFLSKNMLGNEKQAKTVGLLSRTSGEGVTTTALGLAMACHARSAKSTILIDANPSKHRAHDMLGSQPKLLSNKMLNDDNFTIQDYVITDNQFGLPLLTLAKVDTGFTCSFVEFESCLDTLLKMYRTVIIDMGAWSTEAPLAWLEKVNDLVLTIDSERTTQEMLTHFKKNIELCGCELSGFIMNKHEKPIPGFVYRMISA